MIGLIQLDKRFVIWRMCSRPTTTAISHNGMTIIFFCLNLFYLQKKKIYIVRVNRHQHYIQVHKYIRRSMLTRCLAVINEQALIVQSYINKRSVGTKCLAIYIWRCTSQSCDNPSIGTTLE